jgi:hypothetical protein
MTSRTLRLRALGGGRAALSSAAPLCFQPPKVTFDLAKRALLAKHATKTLPSGSHWILGLSLPSGRGENCPGVGLGRTPGLSLDLPAQREFDLPPG